jgi:hypothetical protein
MSELPVSSVREGLLEALERLLERAQAGGVEAARAEARLAFLALLAAYWGATSS